MSKLLLVPLEDLVVFPNMNVTLTVDVGDEERVLLVPQHENEYAAVGTVAEVTDRVRLPGGGRAVALTGLHRGIAGAASTDPRGRLYVEVEERPDEELAAGRDARAGDASTAPSSRRSSSCAATTAASRRSSARSASRARSRTRPATRPTSSFEQKVELLETVDVRERLELSLRFQRERLATMQVRRRIREDVDAGVEKQQREYILRKQLDSIRKELGEDDGSVVEEYRTKIAEAGMPDEVREQAERELGRFERMGESSPEAPMIRNYLDWLLAVPWGEALRGAARPAAHARGARRRPRRARGRQGPDRRVHRRPEAARGARDRAGQALRRDPDARRAARHRQDVDRRVDRARARPRVRPHVARRRARRGGDPRPPAHLHRRAAGPARAGAARRGDDEPGDPAGRGRQGRRRLARRPVGGAARGARPGAEPLVPRSLPRRRARPLRRSSSSPRRTSPRRSPARCSTGWR